MLLELAFWKSKISEINGPLATKMKLQCRTDSVMMVIIIIPNVLSFLTDDNGGNYVVYCDNYNEGNEGDDDSNNEEDNGDDDDSKESDDGDEGNDYKDDDKEDDGDGDGFEDSY